MADTTEGDTKVQYLSLLVLSVIFLIAGLVIHSFIIGVNVNDWWKGRSVTPVDHIVTSLGITRMCAQCAVTLYFFLEIMYSELSLAITVVFYVLFGYANIWLTSLLSIVLCLKISNLHTRLFLYLRRMIAQKTFYFIAASLLFSAFTCLKSLLNVIAVVTKAGTYNVTVDNIFMDCSHIYSIYLATTGTFFPLMLCCISSVLLLTSLYHHTTRMKMSSNLSINLETYYSVMRFVSITFIYKTLYFVVDLVCNCYYYYYCIDLSWLYMVMEFLPALHSSYLIYRTAKFRNQMSKVLHTVNDFLFQGKAPDT